MAIEPVSMDGLLAKLEAARAAVSRMPVASPSAPTGATGATKPVAFAQILKDSLARVDQSQGEAMGLAERFQLGDTKVSLEETMVALSKANISFQQMVQVRNRVIAAYHDIMNLQI